MCFICSLFKLFKKLNSEIFDKYVIIKKNVSCGRYLQNWWCNDEKYLWKLYFVVKVYRFMRKRAPQNSCGKQLSDKLSEILYRGLVFRVLINLAESHFPKGFCGVLYEQNLY